MNNLTDKRFGRLLAISPHKPARPGKPIRWLCACDCGKETFVDSTKLMNGHTISCGCAKKRHGHSGNGKDQERSKTYRSWQNMIGRCTQPSNPAFAHYQRRGITVCDRWRLFENFLADMGERPGGIREYTLERINNDGNYEPGNCRWATWKDQARNRTPNDNMQNPSAKLTDEQVAAIRKDKRSQYILAKEFGVSQGHISRIKRMAQRT